MTVNYLVASGDITQTLSPSSYESSHGSAEELLVLKHNFTGLSWKNRVTGLHYQVSDFHILHQPVPYGYHFMNVIIKFFSSLVLSGTTYN